ncbi:uncharacterized protein LOC110442780 [Mizuhopecten yessoensis]|uniref:Apolipoprotein L3 n=1 Tax=Mizuhopecten yessoensis TaxID=6573 RepID=A0A210PGK6_MIZYE|nr:uncharacterized protein LOC110442780 [Mizuhopecten yessoensis]OWF35576.1 Apolipoprotein L3 [Mizuhopecten yessoensis]
MDFGELLFRKLEETGLDASDVDDKEDDFYRIMSHTMYGDANNHAKCRESICNFQMEPENIHYFELFLQRSFTESPHDVSTQQAFLDDVKKSKSFNTPPTAREIYAACELIGRPIEALVCDLSGDDSVPPRLQWRLFVPVLGRVEPNINRNLKMVILLTTHKTIFHGFKQILEESACSPSRSSEAMTNQSIICPMSESTTNQSQVKHRRCYGSKFSNELSVSPSSAEEENSSGVSEWKPNTDNDTFYQCLSQEMYGASYHWKRVKNLICALEEEEESSDVFAAIITDKDSDKDQALKEHILKIKGENSKPTKTEIYGAASLLNAPVYVLSFINGADTWEIYPPIRNRLQNVRPMDSFVALKCANLTDMYSVVLTFDAGGHNLRETAPKVPGNLFTIREQIASIARDMLARRVPCCEEHHHLPHMYSSGRDRVRQTRRNPFTDPPSNVRNVLKLLRSEGRELEKIEAYDSTLFRCISKEVFGTEEEYKSIRDNVSDACAQVDGDQMPSLMNMSEHDQGRVVQALADWLRVSVYIFTQVGGSSGVQYQWCPYHPSRSQTEDDSIHSLGCRYYITLFYDMRSRKFDRVIPISGCNCQVMSPIPLFMETNGDLQNPGVVRVAESDRHMTLKQRLPSPFIEEQITSEVRRPLMARQFSECYSVLHERQDMSDRFIDSIFQDSHSFYRCLSKELFGSQEHFGLIRKRLLDVIEETRPELEYDLRHLALLLGRSALTVDELKQRILDLENAGKEEIYLTSVVFATSIYLLSREGSQEINNFTWKHYSWNVMAKTCVRHGADKRSEAMCPSNGRYYISLFQSSAGHYDRVVPKYELCNCVLTLPGDAEIGPLDIGQIKLDIPKLSFEERSVLVTRNVDLCLTKLKITLNTWLLVSELTEELCHQIVSELENRRFGVNIATIVGGSTGLIGAGLALAGVIAAPFTAGLSLGLTIAGAAVGGVGGVTMAGSKITEVVLGSKATDVLKVKQSLLKTKSDDLKKVITEFQKSVQTMEVDVKELLREDNLQVLDTAIFSTISTLVRALHHLYVIPMTVLRVSFQSVAVISAILIPLAVLVDVGSIAHAGWNLSKKSRTNVSEDLRRIAILLRSCRIQLDTWAYGNEEADDR